MPGVAKRYRGRKGKQRNAQQPTSSSTRHDAPKQGRLRELPRRRRQPYDIHYDMTKWKEIEQQLESPVEPSPSVNHVRTEKHTRHLRRTTIASELPVLRFERSTRRDRRRSHALSIADDSAEQTEEYVPAEAYMTSTDFTHWHHELIDSLDSHHLGSSTESHLPLITPNSNTPSATRPYVHPRILSWPDYNKKLNNQGLFEDGAYRDTFASLWKTRRGREERGTSVTNTRVGLFSTWTFSWVGAQDLEEQEWHVWGAAIISNGQRGRNSGKHVLIWDCDIESPAYEGQRFENALLGAQAQLVRLLRQDHSIDTVWLGGGELDGQPTMDQNQCVHWTKRWIWKMAHLSADPLSSDDDPRLQGFVKLLVPQGRAQSR